MNGKPEPHQVERLTRELISELEVDWVSIPRMPWFAARILGHSDRHMTRELVTMTLVTLVDNPGVKIVTDDMTRELTDATELIRHLDAEWPDDGRPITNDIGWLVERDFQLRQPLDPPNAAR